jgi:putative acyl-CoA dehydrogenase
MADSFADLNQTPPYVDVDLFTSDLPLQEAVAVNGAEREGEVLSAFGRRWGAAGMFDKARLANGNPPVLDGDIVAFDPAYHHFMSESMQAGLHCGTWTPGGQPAPAPSEVARAARFYMVAQVENGHMCPITMTRASVAALRAAPDLLNLLLPKILARDYDPSFRPWTEKAAITLGMGMTEKQGGTDVRANTTKAVRTSDDGYSVTGHKWFMSAPMCDGFIVLAQAQGGLSCFFMPRFRPDGGINGLYFERLKDKLGNRSNASAEVEFRDAFALILGEEGKGIRTILQMVQLTRLDCAISSAGMMRMALVQALHHARHRSVFQKKLADQPMMRNVLADMALDMEGAVAAIFRLCRSFDLACENDMEAARARLLTPAIKYWICKTAPAFVYEAMECLGGNGYVEDSVLPRLYREAPVNAIWEGSGNVMALDVLRAARKDDDIRDIVESLVSEAGHSPEAAAIARSITTMLSIGHAEANARMVVEQLALLAAAAALTGTVPDIAENFMRMRMGHYRNRTYGAADIPRAASRLLDRALSSR